MERFRRRINEYRGSLYNETELRNEFVNPFFAALGWDMDNRQDLSSDLKEVKVEESIRVEGEHQESGLQLQAGKEAQVLCGDQEALHQHRRVAIYPAFQLRRYAWSASLSLSILTDFEEFAVYDCGSRAQEDRQAGQRKAPLPAVRSVRGAVG